MPLGLATTSSMIIISSPLPTPVLNTTIDSDEAAAAGAFSDHAVSASNANAQNVAVGRGIDGSRVRFGTKSIIIATPFNSAHDEDSQDEGGDVNELAEHTN